MSFLGYEAQFFMLIPLAALVINNILPRKAAGKICFFLTGAVAVAQMALAFAEMIYFYCSGTSSLTFGLLSLSDSGDDFFRISRMTLFFLICIGLVVFVSVMIAIKTIDSKRNAYVDLLMCLMLGMNGMVMVSDLFSLYVFLEITGISSFVMIAMFRSRAGLEGSFKYLVLSALGVVFILLGLSMLFMQTGSLRFEDVGDFLLNGADSSHKALTYASIILLISGFCVKAGAVPFHSWLPDAHQSADTAISVLLSGIVIKTAGIYGLIVIQKLFGNVEAVRLTYRVIGLLTIIIGAVLAAKQNHFKRVVAYSSVSQMGYIILGLSSHTTLGLVAALAHVFSHAVFKSTLFANAAAIHEQTGTLDIETLGGLENKMPVTAFSSVIAFLSTAGIPPLCGFWSKLLIVLSLWTANARGCAAAALCMSIFTSVYFLRLQRHVFFGKTPQEYENVVEIGGSVRLVEILLTAATVGAGLLFPAALIFLQSAGII